MDIFCATRRAGKSYYGHTWCQLFVTDKVIIYIAPMKYKKELIQFSKTFTKDIEAPDAMVYYASPK